MIDGFAGNLGLVRGQEYGWVQAAIFAAALIACGAGLVVAYVPATLLSPPAIARRIAGSMDASGRRTLYLVGVGFLLGLAIRVAFIGRYGTADAGVYLDWGRAVANTGLADAYRADYLPLQFQVLGSISALTDLFGIREVVALKSVNLGCDLGCFALIVVLLQRWAINPAFALVYWLTPYVAGLDWLSYVDFQLGLFALLAVVVISFGNRPVDFMIAGIPLAAALLMKPQSYALLAMLGLFVLMRALVERRVIGLRRWLLLFVAPIAFVGLYSLYFSINGHGSTFVLSSLVGVKDVQPVLSGNMPNLWFIVGHFYEMDGAVATGSAVYEPIAAVATLAVLSVLSFEIARNAAGRSTGVNVLLLFAAASLIVPMTMTQAHENHFFLGAMFGSVLMVIARDWRFTVALSTLLLLQFVNLFGSYGFDNPGLVPLGSVYGDPAHLAVAVAVTVTFAFLALRLRSLAHIPSWPGGDNPVGEEMQLPDLRLRGKGTGEQTQRRQEREPDQRPGDLGELGPYAPQQ